jgi:subtilase family serine protease
MTYVFPRTHFLIIILVLIALFPASALYGEEGLPLNTVAQGVVRGVVLVNGTYGLTSPPVAYTFRLPGDPGWSRIYAGVWGGTEHYTGWVQFEVNGEKQEKITLYGKDDRNPDVYAASHGVYWISIGGNNLLHGGENTVTVRTSRGEDGSKLDGRVYAVQVAAVIPDEKGSLEQYWVAEGNENLHGEGWAGTNPTIKDRAGIVFSGAWPSGVQSADLSALLLATNRGQPDYIRMNGKELGISQSDTTLYSPGAKDIGNEQSFDAQGGPGLQSRYVDLEHFQVGDILLEENTIEFFRGKDLNGDGQLSTTGTPTEAEDYIHPVFVMLVTETGGSTAPVDLAVKEIQVKNTYSAGNGEVAVTVISNGVPPSSTAEITLESDGTKIGSKMVSMDYSGKITVTFPWVPRQGGHTLTARADTASDTRPENNVMQKQVTSGDPPDLSVTIGTPVREGSASPAPTSASIPFILALSGPLGGILLFLNRKERTVQNCAVIMITLVAVCACAALVPPVGADGSAYRYTLPVEVKNLGGSDAGPCDLTIWLDGEKVAVHQIEQGIPAGGMITTLISVTTCPGMHKVRACVDDEEKITDTERADNQIQGMYDFP